MASNAYFNQQIQMVDGILHQLRCYSDPKRVRYDVLELIRNIPSLQPRSGVYGRNTNPFLYLAGTVPVFYRGNQYNIPINVWITEQYPRSGPLVYVTPTPEMIIKPKHKHCDSTGMCYFPYLSSWNPNTCNLIGLIQVVCKVFGEDPPVRSKGAQTQNTNPPGPGSFSSSNLPATSYSSSNLSLPPFPGHQHHNSSPATGSSFPVSNANPIPATFQGNAFENPADVAKRNAVAAVTSKIQQRLIQVNATLNREIEELMTKNSQMEQKIADMNNQKLDFEREKEKVDSEIEDLSAAFFEISLWIEKNDNQGSIDIDAVTEPRDPLSKQLLNLVALDATIEDTLYYLEKALGRGNISVEVFLKTIRNLATDQFMYRATIKKIHEKQAAMPR